VIGATEELSFPGVAVSAREGRQATTRKAGLELAPIPPVLEQRLRRRHVPCPDSVGMKVHDDACVEADGRECRPKKGLGAAGRGYRIPDAAACDGSTNIDLRADVLQRSALCVGQALEVRRVRGHGLRRPRRVTGDVGRLTEGEPTPRRAGAA
jgi:hypothetical protein